MQGIRSEGGFSSLVAKLWSIVTSPYFDRKLLNKVRPYSVMVPEKLKHLKRLAESLNQYWIEGDFVECGVCKGGSAAVIATALAAERHLWLYDSFEGLPDVCETDGSVAKEYVGTCVGSEEDVRNALASVGVQDNQYTIRKGWFSDTFKEPIPEKVALLHCDADWYDSVLLVLDTFYPLVQEGGCVILDDFGWWEGCREAFHDFCCKHGEKPLLERFGQDRAYWIKGKKHNRPLGV